MIFKITKVIDIDNIVVNPLKDKGTDLANSLALYDMFEEIELTDIPNTTDANGNPFTTRYKPLQLASILNKYRP